MGIVYKAHDTRLDRTVAIKVLHESSADLRQRFEREARAVATLQRPHICTLYDVGSHAGADYLVMEHRQGAPPRGPLPLPKVIEYGIHIADALDAAHQKGITHRDPKPANILVTRSSAKVLDFGIARIVGEQTMTLTGAVVGTPAHMAPEQRRQARGCAYRHLRARPSVVRAIQSSGKSLALLHGRIDHPWTNAELASQVGLSRSALVERFSRYLAEPPVKRQEELTPLRH